MIAKGQPIPYDCNFHTIGSPYQRGCYYVWRGHRAVRVLVMLVDTYAIEAELFGVFKFVEVTVVK